MTKKYRKKPVVIEAIKWTGKNTLDCIRFISKGEEVDEGALLESIKEEGFLILTLEGTMEAYEGDYIIKGVNGEFYPCKPDIFAKTYEEADSEEDMVTISKDEHESLLDDREMLNCLEAAGVDNWSGYSDAMEMLEME